jgi:hypothetical protein
MSGSHPQQPARFGRHRYVRFREVAMIKRMA